jgi:hypothetical protein
MTNDQRQIGKERQATVLMAHLDGGQMAVVILSFRLPSVEKCLSGRYGGAANVK